MHPLAVSPLITLTYLGVDTAIVNLPMIPVLAGTSNGPKDIQTIEFGFQNQYFVGINQASFSAFLAKLADTSGATFGLKGTTSVIAETPIGNPTITGIPFSIMTSFGGLNSFGHTGILSNVQVNNPTANYIGINLFVTLFNPSNLTLFTKQVSLPGYYKSALAGRAVIPELDLVPGNNTVATMFQLQIHDNSSTVQEMLSLYLQPKDSVTEGLINMVPLSIKGSKNSNPPLTPYACLEESMEGVTMSTELAGVGTRMVARVRVYIPLDIIVQELAAILHIAPNGTDIFAYSYIDAVNVLPSEVEFVQLSTSVYNADNVAGGEQARFTKNFNASNPFVLPAAITTNKPSVNYTTSPEIRNVLLSQGLLASLPLVGHNVNTDNYVQINVKGPNGTYFIPGLHYIENNVSTTYFLSPNGTGDHGIDIDGVRNLTDMIQKVIDGGLGGALVSGLRALNPVDPASIFQGLTGGVSKMICGIAGGLCGPSNSSSMASSSSSSASLSAAQTTASASTAPSIRSL